MLTTAAVRVSDFWGAAGTVLASGLDKPDTAVVVVSFLKFCPSPTLSDVVVESLRGRPRLRFGDSGGFPSWLSLAGCGVGVPVLSGSGNLGGVLGGRPLFLFKGVTREFTLGSVEVDVGSLSGVASVFLHWFPPRPRPRCCCCSPS